MGSGCKKDVREPSSGITVTRFGPPQLHKTRIIMQDSMPRWRFLIFFLASCNVTQYVAELTVMLVVSHFNSDVDTRQHDFATSCRVSYLSPWE
ncbi:hypothetical protein TNCV_1540661 [Trichonephila clavipes]|nr:hypothetical protein TNCV_1540661 [Trichonephila clavipes]